MSSKIPKTTAEFRKFLLKTMVHVRTRKIDNQTAMRIERMAKVINENLNVEIKSMVVELQLGKTADDITKFGDLEIR